MVDAAKRVDVEGSMAKKQWSTEEFQHVLAVHTEQVILSTLLFHFLRQTFKDFFTLPRMYHRYLIFGSMLCSMKLGLKHLQKFTPLC